jgi:hypothetical protein
VRLSSQIEATTATTKTKNQNKKMNTNESISIVNNANLGEMTSIVFSVAKKMIETGCSIPEELADVIEIKIMTRSSGSKYAVVNFA